MKITAIFSKIEILKFQIGQLWPDKKIGAILIFSKFDAYSIGQLFPNIFNQKFLWASEI